MNKLTAIIFAGLMTVTTASQANPYMNHHGNKHYGHHTRTEWLVPTVIGGVVGYAIATSQRPAQVVVQPQVYPNTYPLVPYGYHYENILDANCNCYRVVLVQNQP